ncbi:MAG: hypothetical protein HRU41_37235 [Saprospiraceae bacterium]|nr:hypothetical protein [Saprospiraceae bacterium]
MNMQQPTVAIRNPEMDLDRIHQIEQLLLELEIFRPDLYILPEVLSAAQYWIEVGQQFLKHEFVDIQDVYMAHRVARGKVVNY